jgi:hypothetical protein
MFRPARRWNDPMRGLRQVYRRKEDSFLLCLSKRGCVRGRREANELPTQVSKSRPGHPGAVRSSPFPEKAEADPSARLPQEQLTLCLGPQTCGPQDDTAIKCVRYGDDRMPRGFPSAVDKGVKGNRSSFDSLRSLRRTEPVRAFPPLRKYGARMGHPGIACSGQGTTGRVVDFRLR